MAERHAVSHRSARVLDDGLGDSQVNTTPFSPRLVTVGGRQYLAAYDHDGRLVVAARDLPGSEWERHRPGVTVAERDGHWSPAVGVGPDGHVFVAYNTRCSPVRWRRSERPGDVAAFGPERVGTTGRDEGSATYPTFTRLGDGTLLFGYREGRSGDGDWHVDRWTGAGWEPLCSPLLAGEGERNAYPWNPAVGPEGRLHCFLVWRETGDVRTNARLSYARSADGGETWERSDGRRYDLPVTRASAEVVDDVGHGENLCNAGWAACHPETGVPHVAYYRDDDAGNTQVFCARRGGGGWETTAVTDRETGVDLGGEGTVAAVLGRPGVAVRDDGTVLVLARDAERGNWPLLYVGRDDDWAEHVLARRSLGYADLHVDPGRWRADRVLSFVDQATAIRGDPWDHATPVDVTDVRVD